MKPFENRRAQIDAYKRNKKNTKSQEINDKTTSSNDIVSFEGKVKGKVKVKGKEDTSSISSSSPIAGEAAAAWERYISSRRNQRRLPFRAVQPRYG